MATLSERIREAIVLIETGTPGEAARAFDELAALANEVEGKVLVKPEIEEIQIGFKFKGRIGEDFSFGETEAEVAANLQRRMDSNHAG